MNVSGPDALLRMQSALASARTAVWTLESITNMDELADSGEDYMGDVLRPLETAVEELQRLITLISSDNSRSDRD